MKYIKLHMVKKYLPDSRYGIIYTAVLVFFELCLVLNSYVYRISNSVSIDRQFWYGLILLLLFAFVFWFFLTYCTSVTCLDDSLGVVTLLFFRKKILYKNIISFNLETVWVNGAVAVQVSFKNDNGRIKKIPIGISMYGEKKVSEIIHIISEKNPAVNYDESCKKIVEKYKD